MDKGKNWVLGKLISVNASFSGVRNVSVCYESLGKLRPSMLGSTRLPIGPHIRTEIIHRPLVRSLLPPIQVILSRDHLSRETVRPMSRVSSKQSNFFFRFEPKQTETQSVSVVFRVCFAKPKNIFFSLFWFVSVFWTGIESTKTNGILSKQTEKISKKRCSIRRSSKPLIFFLGSNQNKLKLSLFRLFFGLLFRETKKFFFRFVFIWFDVSDRYRNNRNKQNLWYGELKRLIF